MKLAHEALDRSRRQNSALQGEVARWQAHCTSIKALPAQPTDGGWAAEGRRGALQHWDGARAVCGKGCL